MVGFARVMLEVKASRGRAGRLWMVASARGALQNGQWARFEDGWEGGGAVADARHATGAGLPRAAAGPGGETAFSKRLGTVNAIRRPAEVDLRERLNARVAWGHGRVGRDRLADELV